MTSVLTDTGSIMDTLTLRFTGENEDGTVLHELRAAHVAEVLEGLVALAGDFEKAGVFDSDGPVGAEVLVRPAREGSFLIEVVRFASENWEVSGLVGLPTLSQVIYWSTKSARADVKDYDYLENGNVKILWQDDTADEVPSAAWEELNKRKRRRKKQLRQIMAPFGDQRVSSLSVAEAPDADTDEPDGDETPEVFELGRADYDAVKPEDEVEETHEVFEAEAQMSAIDFDDPTRWRVKTLDGTRSASVEDREFLAEIASGKAIRKGDIFWLRIREDATLKNGRKTTSWTVLSVKSHRRAANDSQS